MDNIKIYISWIIYVTQTKPAHKYGETFFFLYSKKLKRQSIQTPPPHPPFLWCFDCVSCIPISVSNYCRHSKVVLCAASILGRELVNEMVFNKWRINNKKNWFINLRTLRSITSEIYETFRGGMLFVGSLDWKVYGRFIFICCGYVLLLLER